MKLSVLSALLILLSLTLSSEGEETDSQVMLEAARKAYGEGKFDLALEKIEPLLQKDANERADHEQARLYASAILHRRGEQHFREGRMAESVADFDRELEFQPEYTADHWQRGISLYYAGEYQRGVEQFEHHRTVNPEDVENAVWHFLCAVKAPGGSVEKARVNLIPIQGDGRVPMKEIHQLFAGETTPDTVIAAGKLGGNSGEFYADLYVGLYYESVGEEEKALSFMERAAANLSSKHYMGDVARSHLLVRKPSN